MPQSSPQIDFDQIEEALAATECETSAAELQAVLCGMLAGGLNPLTNQWQSTIIDVINDGRVFNAAANESLSLMMQWSHQQINQPDSLTPILLPDDNYPVLDRLEAIAQWCQGFLLGFGLQTGNKSIANPEVKESLTDIAEISQVEIKAEENEASQTALFTLTEHLKVTVQLIYWEMVVKNTPHPSHQPGTNKTVH